MRITPPANPQRICRYIRLDGLHAAHSGAGQTIGAKKWADPNDHARIWDADLSLGTKLWLGAADVSLNIKSAGYAGASVSLIFFDANSLAAAPTWQASHNYQPGAFVQPATPNGFKYQMVAEYAGESDTAEPGWPTTPGDTVLDGWCLWECQNFHLDQALELFNGTTSGAAYLYSGGAYSGPAGGIAAVALKAVVSGDSPSGGVDVTLKAAYLVLDDLNPRA